MGRCPTPRQGEVPPAPAARPADVPDRNAPGNAVGQWNKIQGYQLFSGALFWRKTMPQNGFYCADWRGLRRVLCKAILRPRGPAAGCAGKTKARRSPALGAFQRGAPEGESEGRQDECKGCWLDRRDQRLRDAVCSLARRLTARERALKPGRAWPLRRVRRAGDGWRLRSAWRSWRCVSGGGLLFGVGWGIMVSSFGDRVALHFPKEGAPFGHRGSLIGANATQYFTRTASAVLVRYRGAVLFSSSQSDSCLSAKKAPLPHALSRRTERLFHFLH